MKTRALREFTRDIERCELCSAKVSPRHQHLIDPPTRKLICVCDGCAVLFDMNGVTKLRRIPRDSRKLADFGVDEKEWEVAPIGLVFFFRSSSAKRVIAAYPSPAGATETALGAEPSWLASLRDDVEALLINRVREKREAFIAPIDRCFELVGLVRTHWKGMSGGDAVWSELDGFFDRLSREAKC